MTQSLPHRLRATALAIQREESVHLGTLSRLLIETEALHIVVPGPPAPYRERQISRAGKTWSTRTDACKDWQAWCTHCAIEAMTGRKRLEGPVVMHLWAFFPIPKSLRGGKARRAEAERENVPHVTRPDRTQIIKAAEDALTRAGVWRDDSQVCSGNAEKWLSPEPRLEIIVKALGAG